MKTLELGRIVKPHGLSGELKVRVHWSRTEAFEASARLIARRAGEADRILTVRGARWANRSLLVRFEGVDHVEQAEALRGTSLHVERTELPALNEGEYYLVDLIGATVTVGPEELGKVVDVEVLPTVDVLLIRTPEGKMVQQPVLDCWLDEIDAEHGRVRLNSRDGLID